MCHTDPSEGKGTEKPRQEHEGVLNEDYRASQGVAVTWTALTGRVVRCGGEPMAHPAQTPERERAHDAQRLLLRKVGKG